MKKALLRFISLLLAVMSLLPVSASASGECISWYVKRNGNLRPVFSPELSAVERYGAYYMDKKRSDSDTERVIYLTFDAGYENGNVEKVLNVLKEKDAPAAFFVLDNLILKNPELIKRMRAEGHLICNHTKNHRNLSAASEEEIARDLTALEDICCEKTGITMDKYFRFPEGKFSISALKHVRALGYKTVFWSFAYDDWNNNRQPDKDAAVKKILSNTHNGAVILLHPTSATNAAILGELIDSWRAEGYRLGTLDELTAE